jgi:hypothetical protein
MKEKMRERESARISSFFSFISTYIFMRRRRKKASPIKLF